MSFLSSITVTASRSVLALLIISVVYTISLIIYRLFIHPLAGFPGPLLARITNFYAVYHAYVGDLHLDMLRCHELYGEFVRYGPNKIIVNTSVAVQDIYARTANVQKSTAYRAFETSPTAHDTQSTVNKIAHMRKRRVIGQAFSDTAIRSLEGHIIEHVNTFIARLLSDCEGTLRKSPWSSGKNMAMMCSYVSFDFMAELVFGKAFHMLEQVENRYIIDLIQGAAFRVGVCLQKPSLALWNVDKIVAPNTRKLRDRYVGLSHQMAHERMNMPSKREDLFSHILAAKDPHTGQGFSLDEIWGESTLLIVAGSDAISTAMAGCFYYLSRNISAYQRVCTEVRSAFPSLDQVRTGSDMTSCIFLRACIDEALRMSPPVGGALWREVCKGGAMINGRVIPEGYDVGVGIYAIQHNPVYYPEPFQYKPERWIKGGDFTEQSIAAARSAFSAFSIGPVGCLGKNLAYLELLVTMARVLWAVDFEYVTEAAATRSSKSPRMSYVKKYKDHYEKEYLLRDRFTSWKDGPVLSFRIQKT